MIVWLNGTHGVGKTTTAALVQQRIPGSRVLDAEKVGEVLMDISPGLPATDDFQHWDPWRPLVVETARWVLDHTGGSFRFSRLAPYAEAARTWLHRDAEVVDTTDLTPDQVAQAVMSPVAGVPSTRP